MEHRYGRVDALRSMRGGDSKPPRFLPLRSFLAPSTKPQSCLSACCDAVAIEQLESTVQARNRFNLEVRLNFCETGC